VPIALVHGRAAVVGQQTEEEERAELVAAYTSDGDAAALAEQIWRHTTSKRSFDAMSIVVTKKKP